MLGNTRWINLCDLDRIMVDMQFTDRKQIGVAKKLNCALLEKIQCLLPNTQLDK